MSRTTSEGPSGNQPDDGDCVVCGDPADGIDARTLQPVCRKCAKIRTDGGRVPEGQPIDPLVCPRGHHAIDVDATRFGCETCRDNDLEPSRWDKSELVDLRTEEPPLADDGDPCPDCGEVIYA